VSASHGRQLQQWGEDCWERSCRRRTEIQSVGLVMQSTAQTPHCHWCGVGEETAREDLHLLAGRLGKVPLLKGGSGRTASSDGRTMEGASSDRRQWKEGLFWRKDMVATWDSHQISSMAATNSTVHFQVWLRVLCLLSSCSSVAISALSS